MFHFLSKSSETKPMAKPMGSQNRWGQTRLKVEGIEKLTTFPSIQKQKSSKKKRVRSRTTNYRKEVANKKTERIRNSWTDSDQR